MADLREGPGASGSATDSHVTKFLHVIEHPRWHLIISNQVLTYYPIISYPNCLCSVLKSPPPPKKKSRPYDYFFSDPFDRFPRDMRRAFDDGKILWVFFYLNAFLLYRLYIISPMSSILRHKLRAIFKCLWLVFFVLSCFLLPMPSFSFLLWSTQTYFSLQIL